MILHQKLSTPYRENAAMRETLRSAGSAAPENAHVQSRPVNLHRLRLPVRL